MQPLEFSSPGQATDSPATQPLLPNLTIKTGAMLSKSEHSSEDFTPEEIIIEEKSPFFLIQPKYQFTPGLRDHSSDEELGEGHAEEPSKGGSIKAVMYLMNTIIGGGVVSLPFVMSKFGLVLGLGIFVLVYVMTLFSCLLLLRVKNNSKRSHYGTIGTFCFGFKGKMAIDVIIIINNFGMCMSYFIIFGQNLEKIIQETLETDSWWSFKYLWIILIWLVIFPFVFFKNFDRLKFVSMLSTASIITYFFLTIYNFLKKWANDDLAPEISVFPEKIFNFQDSMGSFPSVFLAFTFQYNFFPVYKTVREVNDSKMMWISFSALTLVLIVYSLVGVCGYLSYGDSIQTNFLKSIVISDIGPFFYYLLLVAFSTAVSFSVPLFFFGCRNYLISFYQDVKKYYFTENREEALTPYLIKKPWSKRHPQTTDQKGDRLFFWVTIVLYIVVLIFAIFLKEIGPIFNVVGAICANAISFLLPAAFYLKVRRKKLFVYKLAWLLFVIGIITGILSLAGELAKIV